MHYQGIFEENKRLKSELAEHLKGRRVEINGLGIGTIVGFSYDMKVALVELNFDASCEVPVNDLEASE